VRKESRTEEIREPTRGEKKIYKQIDKFSEKKKNESITDANWNEK